MQSLPIISLKGFSSSDPVERQSAVLALGTACREVGFFYLVDHSLTQEDFLQIFTCAKQLFDLPGDEKQAMSIKQSPHNRGYVAMADERLDPKAGADQKEAFNIGVDLPEDHPDVLQGLPFRGVNYWPPIDQWKAQVLAYFDRCVDIGRSLHRGFGEDLGCGVQFFDDHLTHPIATLRMLHYPERTNTGVDQKAMGAGAHTDYGNVTLLATDGVAGLEVFTRSGEWIEAPSVEGAFICNIGDCLMRWSNDTYVSTPHRVRAPNRERYSIAFFLEVNPESIVDPLDIFPEAAPKYGPIGCADYLASRLDATYGYRVKFPKL